MLWSLVKILLFVAAIAGLTWGAGYLLESEGGVVVTVAGVEYTLSALQSVIALLVLVGLVWLGFKLLGLLIATLRFLNGDETAISRYFDRNRERKGYKALSDGLVSLASGDGFDAMEKARKAERYLGKPELTTLLIAQAAELQGDTRKAAESYKKLLSDQSTRFVGVRGLMKQKLEEGNIETALKLAETAFALKPRHVDTQDTLLKLQADSGDWSGARDTLSAKLRYGTIPRDVHRRRDAVLALSEAKDILEDGKTIEAREEAIAANRKSPDLVPAAVMAAQGYMAQEKPRYATRVLKKAWASQPHPDLAAAFAEIEPEESPEARIKRFKGLIKSDPDNAEARMLMAELYIAAEDFPEARRSLGDLYETAPTTRALTIMAAVERGEGSSDTVVRGWLAKALTSPRGPQWVCGNCHSIQAEWTPCCTNCESFDTLSWTTPPEAEVSAAGSASMLPLIVGAIEDKSAAQVEDVQEAEIVAETAESPENEDSEKPEATSAEPDKP